MGLKLSFGPHIRLSGAPADNYPGLEEPPVAAPAAVHNHSCWSEYVLNVTQDRIKFYYWPPRHMLEWGNMDHSREVRIRRGKDSEFAQQEHRIQRKASNIP